ncbi:MAG: mycofactocin biosynthesis chaperone MftB [Deltaproteobacteria bacterium]|nr:mycofactocin biosynthesis chaperone MftB [Deltaproteobacteria bacterium]
MRVEIGKSIKLRETPRYVLASGTQVREEDFGLLFYTMTGPRLYFLSSGALLDISFFDGALSLSQWIKETEENGNAPENRIEEIVKSLGRLKDKGVIVEC